MEKKWQYFFFLIWLGYALILSLLLFTNGFLLNKTSLTNNSSCVKNLNDMTCENDKIACLDEFQLFNKTHNFEQTCLNQGAKVILVLIDAFRYDFALYNESAPYEYYLNKLPIINNLLLTYPNNTRLYKFIADPPTTTMQRLKALTTGTLPTFIDAGSNFATPEINEDNFIDQAVRNDKKVVFLGDDTWDGLYPNRFLRSYPFPSFNVHDLDTVDYGITKNIYNEMDKNDWDLLIAHYLGVDHCGHRYGPSHPEMARKLNEMNGVLKNITSNLDDDTILFVVGDHGMTITGDHGGDSKDEITAAMFVHSKRLLKSRNLMKDEIMQIDLVPTVSSILGIPIPYSNLGFVISDTLPSNDYSEYLLRVVWNNVHQILSYIKHYSSQYNAFNENLLKLHDDNYKDLGNRLLDISDNFDYIEFIESAEEFALQIRKMCEKEWTQFNSLDMIRGLLNFFVTIFFIFILVDGVANENFHHIFGGKYLLISYFIVLLPIISFHLVFTFTKEFKSFFSTSFFLSSMGSTAMLAILVGINWIKIPEHWYESSKRRRWIDQIARIVLMFSVCGLFSNSYIIEESLLLLYLWFALVVIVIIDLDIPCKSKYRRKITKMRVFGSTVIVFLILRYTYYFVRCREEQQWCYGKDYFQKFSNSSSYLLLAGVCSMLALVVIVRVWLKHTGNLTGYCYSVIIGNFVPTVMVVLMSFYWILQGNLKQIIFDPFKLDLIAWCIYGLFFLSIFSMIFQPLLVDIQLKQYLLPRSSGNVIPQLFKQIKTRLNEKSENVPVICGLGTTFSATYISIGLYFALFWAFILGGQQATPVAILFLIQIFVLFLSSLTRFEKASTIRDIMTTPNAFIIIWSLLSNYFFYSSGHQPTFSNIVWDAAFIGTGGALKNIYLQGFLIVVNTFGSHILMGLTLPLLLISPFTIQFIKQELRPKKIDNNNDLLRGDIILYENENWLFNSACILCCKYILLSALRVFFSMITATIHCRHLMVWSIFAPKFIFESIALIVTILSVILGYLLLIVITHKLSQLFEMIIQKTR